MNVIWDFDGTIFDTYPRILHAFDSVLNVKYGLKIPTTRMEDLVFVDTKHCVRVIAGEFGFDFEALLKEIRTYYDENGTLEAVFPEVKEVLLRQDDKRHFIVTHRDRASLMERLRQAEIQDRFSAIIAKEDGFKEKPNPVSFENLIGTFNLSRNETVAIGDRDIDVGAGRNAGVRTILISRRTGIAADFRIPSSKGLQEILEKFA